MPPHWFRPINPNPHPIQDKEKVKFRYKDKGSGRRWAITVCDTKPDPDAILLTEDDLEQD